MRERFQQALTAMRNAGAEALVLTPGADLFYLTGFEHAHAMERLLALVLKSDGTASWIAPRMNVPQVERRARDSERIFGWTDEEGYLPVLKSEVTEAASIAFDEEARAGFLLDLMSVAPRARLLGAGQITRGLRIRKDASELAALRKAASQVDQTIAQAIAFCRPGRREDQVDRDLRAALLARDPESHVAFTIIATGPNSALPHHETARRTIEYGDVVILDFGTRGSVPLDGGSEVSRLYGYQSDITVTCGVGEPTDAEVRQVYQVVWEAQQAAIREVRPGASCHQIDQAARTVIESTGYSPYFIHRTGHGLGLSGHEPPYLRSGNFEVLEESMVFSIEPGIYLPGRFGVRLEVIVAVGKSGPDLINASSAPQLPVTC